MSNTSSDAGLKQASVHFQVSENDSLCNLGVAFGCVLTPALWYVWYICTWGVFFYVCNSSYKYNALGQRCSQARSFLLIVERCNYLEQRSCFGSQILYDTTKPRPKSQVSVLSFISNAGELYFRQLLLFCILVTPVTLHVTDFLFREISSIDIR